VEQELLVLLSALATLQLVLVPLECLHYLELFVTILILAQLEIIATEQELVPLQVFLTQELLALMGINVRTVINVTELAIAQEPLSCVEQGQLV